MIHRGASEDCLPAITSFERLNRRSFDHVCRVERLISYYNRYAAWVARHYPYLPPPPDYSPIMRGR